MATPTLDQVKEYLRDSSWSDADVADALAAELAAQDRVCNVPDPMPDDLAQALKRRVQCNLARRMLPLAVLQGDADAGTASRMPPGNDPEVRRFEKPHRKLVMG